MIYKYYVVIIHVDEEGNGPVSPQEAVETFYEVWDDLFVTHFASTDRDKAYEECDRLNRKYYEVQKNEDWT